MSMRLSEIRPGERCTVTRVEGEGVVRRRLFDMGLTPGVEIQMRRIAPLGDPMEMTLRGYQLSLRREEAAPVVVERLEDAPPPSCVSCDGCKGKKAD